MSGLSWDDKTMLCRLSNNACDKESRGAFLDFVVSHMDNFDSQAWDMFFTGVGLVESEMAEHKEHHKKISEKAKSQKSSSYATALRMALYENLTQEITES